MQHYATNPQVIHETIEGETIIIDLATGTYFSLQGAAPAIWNALTEGQGNEQIVARLQARYDADPTELAASVEAFLGELESVQLIARSTNGEGRVVPAAVVEPGTAEPFVAPRLEQYTDMQDIILLDPVHKVDDSGWPHAAPASSDVA